MNHPDETLTMSYRTGYKHQLAEPFVILTNIRPEEDIHTSFISLYKDGLLYLQGAYAWDGASGPTADTKAVVIPSCVHDALYQLVYLELLPEQCLSAADLELEIIATRSGMWKFRAKAWRKVLGSRFGKWWRNKFPDKHRLRTAKLKPRG